MLAAADPRGLDARGEELVPLGYPRERVPLASAIRSTTLIASLAALDRAGLLRAYHGVLPRAYAQPMTSLVAGEWLSMELGIAHYATVEQLGISVADARANGRRVAEAVQNSHFATVMRALGAGVTMWPVLARIPNFVGRLMQGGGSAVYRLGPKDARLELHGFPIARFQYVRAGWAGMLESTLELLARRVYARDVSPPDTESVAKFSLSWA